MKMEQKENKDLATRISVLAAGSAALRAGSLGKIAMNPG
jgi:hypothetical protein